MEDFDEESASSNMKPLIQRMKHKAHPTLARQNVMDQMESLDFQLPDNKPTRSFYKNPKIKLKSALKVIAKWLIHWSLGFLLGVVVFIIRKSVNWLNDTKFSATSYFISRHDLVSGFFVYLGINFIYVFASWFVVYMCGPLAGGSGIPEVKGYLNGIRIKGTINIKTFIGKIVSIIFSFSSCLALGPEGPMVHIGSVIGAGLAMTKSRTFGFRLPKVFKILRNDYDQRDFIVSGAAAGISAAFGAPIGGVLFVLEEAATFWSREITWRSFFACMVSAFTINLLVNGSSHGMVSDYGLVTFGASRIASYRFYELLPFTLLGICGGLLGAGFVKLNVSLMKWRRDFLKDRVFPRFAELMFVLVITSVLSFWLPLIGSCRPITDIHSTEADGKCDVQTVVTSSIYCPEGYFSDVANLFMSPQEDALKLMFARATGIFHTWALALYATVYFFLVTVTAGLPIAGGLFVPMMLIGATYGRIAGETMAFIFPSLHPPIDESIYALIGAGAMMTGFSRITISLCVIMIEITQNVQYLLPIMIAVMFAKWTGDALSHSIYEDLMELKSIPFLEHHPPRRTYCESITAYMKHNPVCINRIERVSTVVQILNSCTHNGFPVVSNDGNGRELTYRGFILRKQLLVLLERQLYHTKLENTPGTLDFEYISDLMSHSEFPVNKLGLPEDMQENLLLDVQPYMDTSHVIIQSTYSFLKAYDLFRLNGLRHVPVVDEKMQVVGILTRHDLLLWHFEDHEETEEEKNSK